MIVSFIACSPREQADRSLQSTGRAFYAPTGNEQQDEQAIEQTSIAQAPSPVPTPTRKTAIVASAPVGKHTKPYEVAPGITTTEVFKMCLTDLKYHEWFKHKPYYDPGTVGGKRQKNIGYGTKLPPGYAKRKITELEASKLAIDIIQKEYDQSLRTFPHLHYHQHMAVALKAYNMGWTRFSLSPTFKRIASRKVPTQKEWLRECTYVDAYGNREVSDKMRLRRMFEYQIFCGHFDAAKKHTALVRSAVHQQIQNELQLARS